MWWIFFVVIQVVVVVSGIRKEQRAGMWSWSKFVFALAFGGLEVTIMLAPVVLIGVMSPQFMPVFIAASVIAALNFIWMIIVARRWRLPDGRTSLEAYRDAQRDQ